MKIIGLQQYNRYCKIFQIYDTSLCANSVDINENKYDVGTNKKLRIVKDQYHQIEMVGMYGKQHFGNKMSKTIDLSNRQSKHKAYNNSY